jgi:sulfide:quinone oxidoreductase
MSGDARRRTYGTNVPDRRDLGPSQTTPPGPTMRWSEVGPRGSGGTKLAIPRVVVLGGGFAGLETAFMLRMALGPAVEITVVSDQSSFLLKPNTIYIPFGADEESMLIRLHRPLHRRRINFQHVQVMGLDPDRRRIELGDGTSLAYDFAVVGTGAGMRAEDVPGLAEYASTIWTPTQMSHLGGRLEELRERAHRGEELDVLFLVPPGNKCAGPLYEIAFMLETWLRRHGVRDRVHITWSTTEPSFIHAFGPRLHGVVTAEFAERGITGHTGEVVTEVKSDEVRYADGTTRRFDELVSFPPYAAAVHYDGLPTDDRGFLACEPDTRQVTGWPEIYAPGDAGDFPVKQAFLAFLQADAAADHLASRIGRRPFVHPFDPVSMCVMEMFDKATFAQVPLRLTGDATDPVAVRPGANGAYRVGVSPLWRLGKKALGLYLPLRFRRGQPFHAGTAWQAMDLGLRGMARVLAD